MATLPNWRSLPITDKQHDFIIELSDTYGAPDFTGSTRGEACDYIKEYIDLYHYYESEMNWLDICDTY